jgi:hypothetical protein
MPIAFSEIVIRVLLKVRSWLIAGVALQAQLDVARGALVDAALVEHIARALQVFVVHQDRVMLADQFVARVAEQL